ncbi:MAG: hypothetical protein JW943_05840 [Deltaproteobacteria bacterium]|nr:hypothetical protein [Deltaproteobacteria bacterium]
MKLSFVRDEKNETTGIPGINRDITKRRVADLACAIAAEMSLTSDQIDGIRMAATIHDLGKISIPPEIVSKPTKLTDGNG